MSTRIEHVVPETPYGTRFTMTGGIDQFGLGGRLLSAFARPALRRETADHLKNLKGLLESGEHPPSRGAAWSP